MNIPEHWNDGIARMTTAEVNAFAREAHGKIAALTRDLEEAREVIVPFAREAATYGETFDDDERLARSLVTVGDLRAAAALQQRLSRDSSAKT